MACNNFTSLLSLTVSSRQMFEDTEVGDLPDCSTREMLAALDGHLSLVHSNYAPDSQQLRGGRTVAAWKRDLERKLRATKREYEQTKQQAKARQQPAHTQEGGFGLPSEASVSFNKYSGYV